MRLARKYFAGGVSGFAFNAIISTAVANYDLRAAAVSAGWDQIKPLLATVSITSTGVVYSNSTAVAFLIAGAFPANSNIDLSIASGGAIYGSGGSSVPGGLAFGSTTTPGGTGNDGGPALSTTRAVTISNLGTIGGGGGSGGGGGAQIQLTFGYTPARAGGGSGGSGAGYGSPAQVGSPGEYSFPPAGSQMAQGGDGGNGGGFGVAGGAGTNGYGTGGAEAYSSVGGAGGAAGNAVVGNSFITWTATGTRLGGLA